MRNNTRKKRRNPHMTAVVMDAAHVILCIGIVVLAVIIFMNPEQFQYLFPVVFALAAVMQFLHGIPKILAYRQSHGMEKGRLVAGVLLCGLGVILMLVAAVSGVTIWG